VEDCLRSLMAQQGVPGLRILVLDDDSVDATAQVARLVAAGDPRVEVISGVSLPAGWLGKPHACQQLADWVRAAGPTGADEVLVFVDADVVLAPRAVAACLGLLDSSGLDLLSPYPRILASGAQPLVQPLLQWSWLTFLPLRLAERSARPSLTAAGGQFFLVRRAAYDAAGGHAAVRDRVLEDIELARAVKRSGGRVGLADGSQLAFCEMYDSWSDLVDGYTKSLWASFGSLVGAAAVLLMLLLAYVAPPVAAVVGLLAMTPGSPPSPLVVAGVTGYLAGVAGRAVTARATGSKAWPDAFAHPVSILLLTGLVVRSFLRRDQVTWKNRSVLVKRESADGAGQSSGAAPPP